MYSVTSRIEKIQQPKNGYVPVRSFQRLDFDDGQQLCEEENIHGSLVGMAVDYLARYMMGVDAAAVFAVSLKGAQIVNRQVKALRLLDHIMGLDDQSIIAACRLSGFDMYYRSVQKGYTKPVEEIKPDANTIWNIRLMTERTLGFFSEWGPVINTGFTFEGGYSALVSKGDGDYLTADAIWDLKVSKNGLRSSQTLQLLMYYIMGKHSIHREFQSVKYIGVFNPRLNRAYCRDITTISCETIDSVEREVICYGKSVNNTQPKEKKINWGRKIGLLLLICVIAYMIKFFAGN